ncbi:alpha/beta hydrolase [Candidatus Aalborgicola defluviihabitans]|uniref:alpha/beta hydrolase n=1 Tax=Candidatus Aalborgicola defluviihabitans TaxID=3386187 RepID=UPI001DC6D662|nr:alpha/beta hydrolase [Burkholderiales bacterium]MBK7279709.1 alpha/beta hydrolase [Burkholderiales bacterium]MBK7312605.1 alpha/beta hydrolase [Burkholderiales bacterium]MBL0243415.1 alpha/beta hydrolase [Rhodoferax sp.]
MPKLYREFTTQAQIDAQYNPSLALADASAPGKHFVAAAHKARSSLKAHLDIPYGPTLAETLDIFVADAPNAPVYVFLHGGYWRSLSSKEFSGVALGLQPLGITTVVVNYALCPFVTLAEITRQCRAAVAWTLRNIGQYGGDASRVGVGGHSAGGHLSAMCLQTDWDTDYGLPRDPLKAALLISGLHELEPLRYSYLQPMIQLDEHTIRHYSPAQNVRACPTPTWVTWGGAESTEFARQAASYHAAATALGNPVELRAVPGADHFSVIHGLEDSASPMSQWLAEKLKAN